MTTVTYLSEVVISSVQTISDSMPIATSGVAPPAHSQRGLQSVKRAGADVAVDDTERAKHQGAEFPGRNTGGFVTDSRRHRHSLKVIVPVRGISFKSRRSHVIYTMRTYEMLSCFAGSMIIQVNI